MFRASFLAVGIRQREMGIETIISNPSMGFDEFVSILEDSNMSFFFFFLSII